MSPEEQRIAIAEACGWSRETRRMYVGENNVKGWGFNRHLGRGDKDRDFISRASLFPDYLNSLEAMHKAEAELEKRFDLVPKWRLMYGAYLFGASGETLWACLHATAAQRAEALLRTIGKWDDTK